MKGPLVSAIIPAHDGERFLGAAIESVLGQEYSPLEVIVVDDGSTDASVEIAASFPVRCLRQPNLGVAAARNAGLAAARGDVISFLDQDDLWPSGKLAVQVGHLLEHPELGFVVGRMEVFLEPGSSRPAWMHGDQPAFLLGALVARRHAFDRVGAFQTRYMVSSDADWFARAKDAGIARAVLSDVVLRYRVHEQNASHGRDVLWHETMDVLRRSVERRRARREADGD
jgi:glycosyltransferase involved in cell wall biosynthesis